MIADAGEVAEVLCEQHEDVLVKHNTGLFHGVQVKTQDQGGPPWKTTDEPMESAVSRFASLESQFSPHFYRYSIASNHPFLRSKAGTSFYYVIDEAASNPAGTVTTRFIKKVAKSSGISEDVADVYNFSDLVFHLAGVEPIRVRKSKRDPESPLVRLSVRDL
jgi:hypothetical protein